MTSAEFVRAARLEDGLAALQAEIRAKPEDPSLRIFLFQLNCVLGRWEKALTQLQVVAGLSAESMLMAQIFRPVISCEVLRREVFAGKRTPLLFGKPAEWQGWLVQANQLLAQGQTRAAAELRQQAFDAAPASSGTVDGESFEWIADADSRFGPMLEAIIEGKYYWVPFRELRRIETPKPSDLRDLVWTPAQLTLSTGATIPGHIPTRYPGTEDCADGPLRLARSTEWRDPGYETNLGLGQRLLATSSNEYGLLSCRVIELALADPETSAAV